MTANLVVASRPVRLAVITAITGTVLIALGAFWLSFSALADLAGRSGISEGQAWAWPLIVDGVIVVATVSVVALAGQRVAWYPWLLLAAGAVVSVTANAIHAVIAADADVPDVLAASVAAVPPVVLLAITHLTVILSRTPVPFTTQEAKLVRPLVTLVSEPAPDTNVTNTKATNPREGRTVLVEARRARGWVLHEAGWSNKRIARELGVHPSTVGRWFANAHLSDTPGGHVRGHGVHGRDVSGLGISSRLEEEF